MKFAMSATKSVSADRLTEPEPREANRRLILLTSAHGVTHMRGSILPLIYPLLMKSMGFGYVDLGLMLSITRFIGGIMQGIWGSVSRIIPGKWLIVMENIGVSLGIGLVGVSHTYPELVGTVTLGQVAASPHHPIASSMLSRWFGKKRGGALSMHFAGANFATVISPLIATFLLVRIGWHNTLFLFTIPGVLVAALIVFALPLEMNQIKSKARGTSRARFGLEMFRPLKDPQVRRLIATASVTAGGKGNGILQTFVPLLLIEGLHLPTVETGILFTVFTATSVVGPLLAGRISDRFNRPRFLSVLLLVSFASAVATGLFSSGSLWLLVPILVIFGLFVHAYSPVEQAVMGDISEQTLHEESYSLFYGITFGVSAAWPLFFSFILSQWGFGAVFFAIGATYLLGAWMYGTKDWSRPNQAVASV